MQITRRSALTGITRTRDLPITMEQLRSWKVGMPIQDAIPHLTNEQREFIMTGTTQEEWAQAMGEEVD